MLLRYWLNYSIKIIFFVFLILGCASRKTLKYEKIDEFQMNKEFEEMVKVEEAQGEQDTTKPAGGEVPKTTDKVKATVAPVDKNSSVSPSSSEKRSTSPKKETQPYRARISKLKPSPPSQPVNWDKLRPEVDPFQVGEEVELAITYFNMAAGYMTLKVNPFVQVNGKKSYDFTVNIKSSKVFSYFYAVDDRAQTFVDYNWLTPSSYTIKVNEAVQLKDIRSFFDPLKQKAVYWEKKVAKGKDEEHKKKEWEIDPLSQNVISAIFYLRTLNLEVGREVAFTVADAGKNLVFRGDVLRQEVLNTEIGEMDTLVVQPKFEIDGVFKPVGDIFIWLTNDERKFPVRIDAKIKIGTLVLKLKSLKR